MYPPWEEMEAWACPRAVVVTAALRGLVTRPGVANPDLSLHAQASSTGRASVSQLPGRGQAVGWAVVPPPGQ